MKIKVNQNDECSRCGSLIVLSSSDKCLECAMPKDLNDIFWICNEYLFGEDSSELSEKIYKWYKEKVGTDDLANPTESEGK